MSSRVLHYLIASVFLVVIYGCGSDDEAVSSENEITSFTVAGITANILTDSKVIRATVPASTSLTALAPEIVLSAGAMVTPASGVPQDFTEIITYTVTAEDGSTQAYRVDIGTDTYSFIHNGKQYDVVEDAMTWSDAAAVAVSRGGYLVEINDIDEQVEILNQVTRDADLNLDNTWYPLFGPAIWLGGIDREESDAWVWDGNNDGSGVQFWDGDPTNGQAVNDLYHNWVKDRAQESPSETALSMMLRNERPGDIPGVWNDLNADEFLLFFVIEYD